MPNIDRTAGTGGAAREALLAISLQLSAYGFWLQAISWWPDLGLGGLLMSRGREGEF